ncbi:MAG TPA: hypothetical protein VK846_11220 [Candidatus Limnocylindria bacterium]|nr:hypothetical protein [Candidatus Limnocylindria bacterium]
MKRRNDIRQQLDLHAEWYHRLKLDALRAEGERLRHELRRLGLDPASILMQAQRDAPSSSPGFTPRN